MSGHDRQGSLGTLSHTGKLHGYGIVLHLQRTAHELLRVEEGSHYLTLRRMGQSIWIASEWALTQTGRKSKQYRLTASGRKRPQEAERRFKQLVKGVRTMLRYA